MQQEIEAAVNWWKSVMRNPKQDAGDGTVNMVAAWAKSHTPPMESDKIEDFGRELSSRLPAFLKKGAWKDAEEGDSGVGSMCRVLAVDYGPDTLLREAAEAAGIRAGSGDLCFPIKTVMWINPGRVSVSYGYGAKEEVIFEAEKAKS